MKDFALKKNYLLYLQHDPINESCKLQSTEKGIRLKSTHPLIDFL